MVWRAFEAWPRLCLCHKSLIFISILHLPTGISPVSKLMLGPKIATAMFAGVPLCLGPHSRQLAPAPCSASRLKGPTRHWISRERHGRWASHARFRRVFRTTHSLQREASTGSRTKIIRRLEISDVRFITAILVKAETSVRPRRRLTLQRV